MIGAVHNGSRQAGRVLALLGLATALSAGSAAAKDRPYLRESEQVAALRQGWTRAAQAKALAKWDHYVRMTDDEIWSLMPGPKVYRAFEVSRTNGCPNCGQRAYQIGGLYPFKCDAGRSPWKTTCASCGEVFPKNDFLAFYRSGLLPDGSFDPGRADRRLLFNAEHPDPADPLRAYGVDDGGGFVDREGRRYWFVARCCHELWWQVTVDLRAMAADYQATGAEELGHRAAILLARMADTYPEMDFYSQGVNPFTSRLGGDRGKAIGACGPTSEAGRMRLLLAAYDDVWEIFDRDPGLVTFLTGRAQSIGHPQWAGSPDAIRRHIEQHLIGEGGRDVMRDHARGSQRYGGDVGHMQWTLALQGLVVDDPQLKRELLEWPFAGPYPRQGGMHEVLSGPILGREGAGGSSSPGYSSTHYKTARSLAELYGKMDPPYRRDLFATYPCIKRSYDSQFLFNCCERFRPNIGDCGHCGSPGLICDAATMLDAFRKFGEARYARMAYFLNRHSAAGFPADVAGKVRAIVDREGDWRQTSTNLNGYGLAILRSGQAPADQRAAWMYYGARVTNSHGHSDRLNLGLYAKGLDLMPDLGYPERTGLWPERVCWTNNTVSHNTVMVDRQRQASAAGGRMQLFCESPLVKLVDVAREAVYPQTTLYRRSCALVDISPQDGYLVDIFRVKGGREHHYSFHSAEGGVDAEGLTLAAQAKGTLAGPDVPFGQYDPDRDGRKYQGPGFQFLRNVRRDTAPPPRWSVTWRVKDTWNVLGRGKRAATDIRLRLTMLGPHNEVILATGQPPRLGKPNNPETLEYLLVNDRGDDLATAFVAVIEPFQRESSLAGIRRLDVAPAADDVAGMDAVALEVTHRDGTVDTILSAHDVSTRRKAGAFEFAGAWAFVRMRGGRAVHACLAEGTRLAGPGFSIALPEARAAGVIADMDRAMSDHNCIYSDADLPAGDALAGRWLRIDNDARQDACYEIRAVRRENGRTAIDLGDITLIRQVKEPNNYDAGYTYNFDVGQRFAIPAWAWKDF